jgi:3-dehydroquinate synthase
MKTVHVKASKNYDVLIGSGLLPSLGAHALAMEEAITVCIVSDSNVWPLYGNTAEKSLLDSGLRVNSFVFPAGEESKNGNTYLNLLNHLAENKLTRSDLIVALGGGVVGDLAGFAAATYLRGIRFIQVPTTLLAAVDSSVGGKTAIDLPAGKNLAGAFYQPSLVLCDTNCLNTLPEEIFRDGCAEVIKYGILYDPALFAILSETGLSFDRESVITRCVELKRDVVAEDEFDTGMRMKLNLGHTIGHGVEARSNFEISHGKAVAIGMAIVSRAGCKRGLCSKETKASILNILQKFQLPVSCAFSAESLYTSALSDKKRSGGAVSLIIPNSIGDCGIFPTPVTEIQSFIEAGL